MSFRFWDYTDGWNEALEEFLAEIEYTLSFDGSDVVESLVSTIHKLKIDRDEE